MRKNPTLLGIGLAIVAFSALAVNYAIPPHASHVSHPIQSAFGQSQDQVSADHVPTTTPQDTLSLPELFQQTKNSVVEITSTVSNPDSAIIINGIPSGGQSTRLGSGFIYDLSGHIVTNNHVISGTKTVYVTFADGNTYTAKVIGTDPYNDLAVLGIVDDYSAEKITPLQLADSSKLEIGQKVAAIGNPFGLTQTITDGIVSAIGRSLSDSSTGGFSIPDVIQTDAAINPGNSGGPLLDMYGEVVGMNTAIQTQTGDFAGIGFAIPSNQIARIVPHLIKDGTYQHPWLGIEGRNMDSDMSLANSLPRNYHGVMVMKVIPGSPAAKAGLEAASLDENNIPHGGDIIIKADGHKINTIYDIINYQDSNKSVGDTMTLEINRDGKVIDVPLTLEARPSTPIQS